VKWLWGNFNDQLEVATERLKQHVQSNANRGEDIDVNVLVQQVASLAQQSDG
jgi:hypothetical protein